MPKVSSPARRPHAFNWSSPPWSARGRRTKPLSAQAQRERGKEGRRGRPGGLGIRSSPGCPGPPGSRSTAVSGSQAADQMGVTRRTRGRSLSPARPIPAEEGSDPRCEHPRVGSLGRGLAAGDVGSRRLRLRFGAAYHGLAPGAQTGPRGRRVWGERGPSAPPGPLGPDADSGAGARKQVRAAANSPNLLRGWPLRAAD